MGGKKKEKRKKRREEKYTNNKAWRKEKKTPYKKPERVREESRKITQLDGQWRTGEGHPNMGKGTETPQRQKSMYK